MKLHSSFLKEKKKEIVMLYLEKALKCMEGDLASIFSKECQVLYYSTQNPQIIGS